ncbi:plasmid pRiA4b ORF-3 family protein [Crenothrix sp.]|uniref:plasmid pRiA4b ORF-3 family protein n=1 Tax=Crenothrix sp. TaxID=3100433 RepID=UPI00374D7C38
MTIKPANIYQLKITLNDSKPPIWRRVLVASNINLSVFHKVIQIVMGWTDSHLHQFVAGQVFYAPPYDDDFGMECKDESKYKLSQLLKKEKDKIIYEYDFGDSWRHKIELEKILPYDAKTVFPSCIKGKLACPPEDCGGVWGYADLLETLTETDNPDREELLHWLGEKFEPDYFNITEINAELAHRFR